MDYKKIHFYDQYDCGQGTFMSMSGGYTLFNTEDTEKYILRFSNHDKLFISINISDGITVTISTDDLTNSLEFDALSFSNDDFLDESVEKQLGSFTSCSRRLIALRHAIFGLLHSGPFTEYRGQFKIIN